MKKLLLITLLIFNLPTIASDEHDSGTISTTTTTTSITGSQSTAFGGEASTINSNSITGGSSRGIPTVYAPGLSTTLTETCMGSTSAGAGWFGFGGSFGSTWSDDTCVRRLDARQLDALGQREVALELMCGSDSVREAAKRAGKPCKGEE